MVHADPCSSFFGSNSYAAEETWRLFFGFVGYYWDYLNILQVMLFLRHWNWRNLVGARVILLPTTVWYLDTQSIMVCKGFTATSSLQNCFMAVTDWTSLWFGRRIQVDNGGFVVAKFCLVCSGFAPVLKLSTSRHQVQDVWLCPPVDTWNIQQSWEK